MQARRNIKVRLPNQEIIPVEVQITDPITAILEFVPTSNDMKYNILHNSIVLSPAFSFAFHGINDGDILEIVKVSELNTSWKRSVRRKSHCPTLSQVHEHSKELFRLYGYRPDIETMQRTVEELSDPELAALASKFRDNYFNKIEGNMASHRKMLLRFQALEQIPHERRTSCAHTFNILTRATSPSNSALPCWFEKRRGYEGQ